MYCIHVGTKEDCEAQFRLLTQKSDDKSKKRRTTTSSKEAQGDAKKSRQDKAECSSKSLGESSKALAEEQIKLKNILGEKTEDETRSFSLDVIFKHGLSDIVKRLNSIESKVDELKKSVKGFKNNSSCQEDRGSPKLSPGVEVGLQNEKEKIYCCQIIYRTPIIIF